MSRRLGMLWGALPVATVLACSQILELDRNRCARDRYEGSRGLAG
jgi:hypothetical protein